MNVLLFMKHFPSSKVTRDSLWANDIEEDIVLDEDEFNKLFIDETSGQAVADTSSKSGKGFSGSSKDMQKKQKIILVDMKRAQNGGIALARIKMPYPEVRNRIMCMADDGLTTEQLKSLEEFLPTAEEAEKLKAYQGQGIRLLSMSNCICNNNPDNKYIFIFIPIFFNYFFL